MPIKKKEGEELGRDNIIKVISLLEGDSPITKKEACSILNISYNTTRLTKIIQEHLRAEEHAVKMRKKMRMKPLSDNDKKNIIEAYLDNESLISISESTFRSIQVIKNVLTSYNVPIRSTSNNYSNPVFFAEDTWKKEYKPEDLVFSAKYNRPCTIIKLVQVHPQHDNVYSIEFHGEDRFFACQPAYELADLTALQKEFGIKLVDMSSNEIKQLLYEAYVKSKRVDKK